MALRPATAAPPESRGGGAWGSAPPPWRGAPPGAWRRLGGRYLVNGGVLPQRQVPEAAADLVPTLAHCKAGKRLGSKGARGQDGRPPFPPDPSPHSPCTTTDCVMAARSVSGAPSPPPPERGRGLPTARCQRDASRLHAERMRAKPSFLLSPVDGTVQVQSNAGEDGHVPPRCPGLVGLRWRPRAGALAPLWSLAWSVGMSRTSARHVPDT